LESKAPIVATRIDNQFTVLGIDFQCTGLFFRNFSRRHNEVIGGQVATERGTTRVKLLAVATFESKAPIVATRIDDQLTVLGIDFQCTGRFFRNFRWRHNEFIGGQVATERGTTRVNFLAVAASESQAPIIATRIDDQLTVLGIDFQCTGLFFRNFSRRHNNFIGGQVATERGTTRVNFLAVTTRKAQAPIIATRIDDQLTFVGADFFGTMDRGEGNKQSNNVEENDRELHDSKMEFAFLDDYRVKWLEDLGKKYL
jgi:hypothetical protein